MRGYARFYGQSTSTCSDTISFMFYFNVDALIVPNLKSSAMIGVRAERPTS
jgi:hypothetical protein